METCTVFLSAITKSGDSEGVSGDIEDRSYLSSFSEKPGFEYIITRASVRSLDSRFKYYHYSSFSQMSKF